MAKSKSSGRAETACSNGESSPQSTTLAATSRIDPPHDVDTLEPASSTVEPNAAAAPISDEPAAEQIRVQADQLAAHLRKRQSELDRREAELNSRIARWESDGRSARMWLEEREADLAARGEELAKQQQDAAKRLERLAAAEAALQKHGQQSVQAESPDAEAVTSQQTTDAERLALDELERKRQAIQRRADHVDHCRASLVQLRDELTHMHRETLEIRLATEELWVQLSGAAPPAALTRSLGRIRTKLAEQYRQANAELAEQRKELEAIRCQLLQQHEALAAEKRRFDRWAADRQEEFEQQASRLIAREQQLVDHAEAVCV
jgi:DNA repair exonuclease SbcCD ATPase subunit